MRIALFFLLLLIIPLKPSLADYFFESSAPNEVQILHRGAAALEKRLRMIERAQREIALEHFSMAQDFSSKVLMNVLLKKAQEGVSVRLLLDGDFLEKSLSQGHAHLLRKRGVELRYYNPLSSFRGIFRSGHRSHRKLLVVDAEEMITGGRDISDAHFELDPRSNFIDRDIWVRSPEVARAALKTFEAYWDSTITRAPRPLHIPPEDRMLGNPNYRKYVFDLREMIRKARDFLTLSDGEKETLEDLREFAGEQLERESLRGSCEKITFATDAPLDGPVRPREVFKLLYKNIVSGQNRLYVEMARVAVKGAKKDEVHRVLEKSVRREMGALILANDFYPTSARLYDKALEKVTDKMARDWLRAKPNTFIYSGDSPYEDFFFQETGSSRFSFNARTVVFDNHSFLIGNYDMDSRTSLSRDSEIGILCHDEELAQGVLEDMETRRKNSFSLEDRKGKRPLLKRILYPILYLPAFLLDSLVGSFF
ncbi:MAG: phospholipase D-like domain-containing protein [Bacteriovoracales bacterium]|nr:phospholipase D-like domain-containing protein [Bacteriovoracales bacterium]